jgi:hypothetical protein
MKPGAVHVAFTAGRASKQFGLDPRFRRRHSISS